MQVTRANAKIIDDALKNDFSESDKLSRILRPRPLQHITDKEPIEEHMNMYTVTFVFPYRGTKK